jgi:hypothetical protein
MQTEYRAIKNNLQYVEETDEDGNCKYYGYVNAQGIKDGLGVLVYSNGDVSMSELKEN